MSLPDGSVELHLVSVAPRLRAAVPLLGEFLENASRELIQLRITGPLVSPDVRTVPLRALSEELDGLFRRRPVAGLEPSGS